ncbi:acyl carrier protein [Paenibacillus peoriae]|uniref:acyl carrier protein n=1 Tax=Paenibacillus peoriae TaxID=59893 RepID=UPI003F9D62D6
MNTIEKVKTIISGIMEVPIEIVNLHSKKNNFEKWDSLNQLTLVMEIESAFGISLNLEEMGQINSVQDILLLVEKHTKA